MEQMTRQIAVLEEQRWEDQQVLEELQSARPQLIEVSPVAVRPAVRCAALLPNEMLI